MWLMVAAVADRHPHHSDHHRSAEERPESGEERQAESGGCDHEHDRERTAGGVEPVVCEMRSKRVDVHRGSPFFDEPLIGWVTATAMLRRR
jgi:hypothetical protein